MRILFSLLIAFSATFSLQAQDTIKFYIDTLGVERISEEPPVYRVALRVLNYVEVDALDIQLRITAADEQRIIEAEVGPAFTDGFPIANPNPDGLGLRFLSITEEALTVPDGSIVFTFDVSGDLEASFISLESLVVEALRDGDETLTLPAISCPAPMIQFNPARALTGQILTVNGDSVGQVIVQLMTDGEVFLQDTTEMDGRYAFPEVPALGSYLLKVAGIEGQEDELRSSRIRGINIGDLVLIARDIVQSDSLETPLAVLAADVSGDGEMSITDLLHIQRYILASVDAYPNGVYYRFFTEGEDPRESVEFLDNIPSDTITNFVIVKMGDVNFSSF